MNGSGSREVGGVAGCGSAGARECERASMGDLARWELFDLGQDNADCNQYLHVGMQAV